MQLSLKDRVDVLAKKADILYKKVVILLALAGGSGAYTISFRIKAAFYLVLYWGCFLYSLQQV